MLKISSEQLRFEGVSNLPDAAEGTHLSDFTLEVGEDNHLYFSLNCTDYKDFQENKTMIMNDFNSFITSALNRALKQIAADK